MKKSAKIFIVILTIVVMTLLVLALAFTCYLASEYMTMYNNEKNNKIEAVSEGSQSTVSSFDWTVFGITLAGGTVQGITISVIATSVNTRNIKSRGKTK